MAEGRSSRPEFEGRVVLVTGAASGIGRAAAHQFANAGGRLVVADLNLEGAQETASQIIEQGGEALAVLVDVSDSRSVSSMIVETRRHFGRLDIALNNAGIRGAGAHLADISDEAWARGIGVMLSGVFFCMKHEIPLMLEQGGGAIVNTSSVAGLVGFPTQADYVAAKHGVLGLTKTAALEYISQGIRVNAICPGVARSGMVKDWFRDDARAEDQVIATQPIGRLAEPAEIAQAAVWLASDAASFVVGAAVSVDGGISIR